MLQDNLDDSKNSNGALELAENNSGIENQKVCHDVDEDDRPAESEFEFDGRFPGSSVQQRELVARQNPTFAERGGIIPFPSESSRQHNSSPKSQSPIDISPSFETKHSGRYTLYVVDLACYTLFSQPCCKKCLLVYLHIKSIKDLFASYVLDCIF